MQTEISQKYKWDSINVDGNITQIQMGLYKCRWEHHKNTNVGLRPHRTWKCILADAGKSEFQIHIM